MSLVVRLRESFWFVPALFCLAGGAAAQGLVAVDRRLPDDIGFIQVGASGSRDLLGAIAGSMLAVASTTFSITIAVLALSSSTYGPRLVRNFMADRSNQVVLGVFVSTFLYALLVLRSVRADGDDRLGFVPHLAVSVAVLFAVVAIGVLVYFIHHISDSIQVTTLARRVREELHACVDRLYPEEMGAGSRARERAPDEDNVLADVARDGIPVPAPGNGYLQGLDEDELISLAVARDVIVLLRTRPGEYVVEDQQVALLWPAAHVDADTVPAVLDTLRIANVRNPNGDVDFAVQQLEEMAVRALSPSTNDPYTAINALDDLSTGLARMAERPQPSERRYDGDGQLRVVAPRVALTDLLDRVFDAMRLYALEHPIVLHHTLTVGERVAHRSKDPTVHGNLMTNTELLIEAYVRTEPQPHDLERLRRHADRLAALTS